MSDTNDRRSRELSLLDMAAFIWRNKLIISITTLVFIVGAVVLAYALQPIYRSDVVFAPAESSTGGLGQMAGGNLGGLAALAGINLGGNANKAQEALEYLRSRTFTSGFIQRHNLMPSLFAKKWDASRKAWKVSGEEIPTISEGVDKIANKIRQIGEDKRTGIVTLSILWSDRFAASQWANDMVKEADDALRTRALAEHGRSIEYLKAESAESTIIEVRSAIFKLMETELKNAMLARTRDAYAFKVLDPAVPRDAKDRDSPRRGLIALSGAVLGFFLGVLIAAIRRTRSASHSG